MITSASHDASAVDDGGDIGVWSQRARESLSLGLKLDTVERHREGRGARANIRSLGLSQLTLSTLSQKAEIAEAAAEPAFSWIARRLHAHDPALVEMEGHLNPFTVGALCIPHT